MIYHESEFETAFIKLLEAESWQYMNSVDILRNSNREVLYIDDMKNFLSRTNPDLTADEVCQIIDTLRLTGAESDFAVLHKNYNYSVNGIKFTPQNGNTRII